MFSADRYGATVRDAPLSSLAANSYRVALIRVDLPEPDTPVMQVSRPAGIARSTSLRLLPVAPRRWKISLGLGAWRLAGTSMRLRPLR